MNQYLSEGFFKSLFDFSFTHFVVTKLVKILYGLGIISGGILALMVFAGCASAGFQESFGMGVLGLLGGLIAAPVVFLFYLIYVRVYLEIVIVMFRIFEHVAEIASRGRGNPGGGDSSASVDRVKSAAPAGKIEPERDVLSFGSGNQQ